MPWLWICGSLFQSGGGGGGGRRNNCCSRHYQGPIHEPQEEPTFDQAQHNVGGEQGTSRHSHHDDDEQEDDE